MHEQTTKGFGKMNICITRFGICIGDRKYLNEFTPFGSVSLCINIITGITDKLLEKIIYGSFHLGDAHDILWFTIPPMSSNNASQEKMLTIQPFLLIYCLLRHAINVPAIIYFSGENHVNSLTWRSFIVSLLRPEPVSILFLSSQGFPRREPSTVE